MAQPEVKVRDHRHGPPHMLELLTYNVQFLPYKHLDKHKRAGLIAESSIMNRVDVIVFQEVFDDSPRKKLLKRLKDRFPYQTRVLGTDTEVADITVNQDGGVVILSRWPIENCPKNVRITVQPGEHGVPPEACGGFRIGFNTVVPVLPGEQRLFGDACSGNLLTQAVKELDNAVESLPDAISGTAEGRHSGVGTDLDCLAKKGVLYARINKQGRPYHVFGTHLDSGSEMQDVRARKKQLAIIDRFIRALDIPADEPVIIAGDFNIGPLGDVGGGDPFRDLYAAGLPSRGGGPSATHVNGQQLDHILYSKAHLLPLRDQSFREVRVATGGPMGKPFYGNLSDHHPLAARLVFPITTATAVPLPGR
jgi:endonuclease/exonuclease/phosphatase family metal-dependent hydrolase